MPRPTRIRALVAPGRSANSFSFMTLILLLDDADEVTDFRHHTADRRVVGESFPSTNLVQSQAFERGALLPRSALRASHLLDDNGLALTLLRHDACSLI